MANKNPNQLPVASTLQDNDIIIVQQVTTNKATLSQLKTYIPAGPTGATGNTGPAGPGLPTGGTAGQMIDKIDAINYNTQWIDRVSQRTGTALSFDNTAVYGTTGTPETGNITGVLTAALFGSTVLVIHDNGSAPTFDGKFHQLSTSGSYVTGVINYIYCLFIDATHILYTICQ